MTMSASPASEDNWVDELDYDTQRSTHPLRAWVHDALVEPRRRIRNFYRFLGTSPGLLATVMVILLVFIAAAGIAMGRSMEQRRDGFAQLINVTEPMANSARNLYTALSMADTAATTSFITDHGNSALLRDQYLEALASAEQSSLETASAVNSTDNEAAALLLAIEQKLSTYTGLIETARTNDRMGNPVGVAYLAEASGLMHNDILPAASKLMDLSSTRVTSQQAVLSAPQIFPLSGLIAAVVFLIFGHFWLAARTRRRINVGLGLAIILMAVACSVVGFSNWKTYEAGMRGYQEAAEPLSQLTTARIAAQRARTEETLDLVMRSSSQSNVFDPAMTSIAKALDGETSGISAEAKADAREQMQDWAQAHQQTLAFSTDGNFKQALDQVISGESASSFAALDNYLDSFISTSRQNMRDYIVTAAGATRQMSATVIILTVISIICLWLGMRPRIQEYR
ncbi:MAG: hypothetical protein Q3962_07200 [Corynebacterium sp.]|nr:hypothetical protein [Corynebacterium sp.]